MITLLRTGYYKLLETASQIKILYLDEDVYAWVNIENIGEILVTSHKHHVTDTQLSIGRFTLYEVDDETGIADLTHLELEVGEDIWQSYLLLSGLPNEKRKRVRIIPTKEVITTDVALIPKINTKDSQISSEYLPP